jgi:hypothetical protein
MRLGLHYWTFSTPTDTAAIARSACSSTARPLTVTKRVPTVAAERRCWVKSPLFLLLSGDKGHSGWQPCAPEVFLPDAAAANGQG